MALTRPAWISSPRQSGSAPSSSDAHLPGVSLIRPSSTKQEVMQACSQSFALHRRGITLEMALGKGQRSHSIRNSPDRCFTSSQWTISPFTPLAGSALQWDFTPTHSYEQTNQPFMMSQKFLSNFPRPPLCHRGLDESSSFIVTRLPSVTSLRALTPVLA